MTNITLTFESTDTGWKLMLKNDGKIVKMLVTSRWQKLLETSIRWGECLQNLSNLN